MNTSDIITSLLGWLPDSTGFSAEAIQSLNYLVNSLKTFTILIPIATLFQAIQIAIAFELSILSLKLGKLVLNIIRGSGA